MSSSDDLEINSLDWLTLLIFTKLILNGSLFKQTLSYKIERVKLFCFDQVCCFKQLACPKELKKQQKRVRTDASHMRTHIEIKLKSH